MKIAIITGGRDRESEVSVKSAKNVSKCLEDEYEIKTYLFPQEWDLFVDESDTYSLVVPLIHGKGGEDGEVPRLLDELNIPYIFSRPYAHKNAFDKSLAKKIVFDAGLKVANGYVARKGGEYFFEFPCVVKPCDAGSSLGVSLVMREDQFKMSLDNAFKVSDTVLVEEYIKGDEYTVGVIDTSTSPKALPVVYIKPKATFFDYESKYNQDALASEVCPAPITEELKNKLQLCAITAHAALEMRDVSRSDMIVKEDDEIFFLETNSIPGMTDTSLIPKELAAEGSSLKEFLLTIVNERLKNSS